MFNAGCSWAHQIRGVSCKNLEGASNLWELLKRPRLYLLLFTEIRISLKPRAQPCIRSSAKISLPRHYPQWRLFTNFTARRMHARPANCTSSRERRFKVGRRIHSHGSAILFLAACRATLILRDRGHKGRRVGRLVGEREEKSPLLSIWIRRRDENTPFVSSNACPFSPPRILPSLPSFCLPFHTALVPCFQPRSYRVPLFLRTRAGLPLPSLLPWQNARPESAPLSCFWDNERTVETKSIDDAVDPPRLILPEYTGIRSYITWK